MPKKTARGKPGLYRRQIWIEIFSRKKTMDPRISKQNLTNFSFRINLKNNNAFWIVYMSPIIWLITKVNFNLRVIFFFDLLQFKWIIWALISSFDGWYKNVFLEYFLVLVPKIYFLLESSSICLNSRHISRSAFLAPIFVTYNIYSLKYARSPNSAKICILIILLIELTRINMKTSVKKRL